MAEIRAPPVEVDLGRAAGQERRWKARKYLVLYVFCLIPATALFVFHYLPIWGVIIAFKDFRIGLGILGSPWNDFQHFRDLFLDPYFGRVLRNTIIISLLKIIFGFPAPVILALLLNELRNPAFKKAVQSISYLPHFMSWVVIAGVVMEILSPQRGLPAFIGYLFGAEEVPNLFMDRTLFRPLLVVTHIWQSVGWGTIVYLAAISTIDPTLYDVSAVDGAGRLSTMTHITLPALVPVMTILFLLSLGHLLNAGFEQIFNLYNPLVYEVADIIDTYVYRVGILDIRFEFGAAVGLFKNVIGVILLVAANAIIRRFSEYAIW